MLGARADALGRANWISARHAPKGLSLHHLPRESPREAKYAEGNLYVSRFDKRHAADIVQTGYTPRRSASAATARV